jgi:hypothetical protein
VENERDHDVVVDEWMSRWTRDLPSDELLSAFEIGLGRIWNRAQQTLGEVTLGAIGERVLHGAIERYPALATLEINGSGLNFEMLRNDLSRIPAQDLERALRFVVVELLTVLGRLTADIMTPALHEALGKARPKKRSGAKPRRKMRRRK